MEIRAKFRIRRGQTVSIGARPTPAASAETVSDGDLPYSRPPRTRGESPAYREPEDLLGPFDRLARETQLRVLDAVETDQKWRLRGADLGAWHTGLARSLKSPTLQSLGGPFATLAAIAARTGPKRGIYALHRSARDLAKRLSSRPAVSEALETSGLDPRILAVCYARNLSQPPGYEGFWHDPTRHVTVGVMLGIDLIRSAQGWWYVESNLNPGLEPERNDLYERDPMISNIVDLAATGGYQRLVVMAGTSGIDGRLSAQAGEEAMQRRVDLQIVDDAFQRRSPHRRSHRIPGSLMTQDTLVVRMKHYGTNLDYLFQHKRGSARALRFVQDRAGHQGFFFPDATAEPVLGTHHANDPFPNLVYKLPGFDAGKGVFFLKATSPDHARRLVRDRVRGAGRRDLISRVHASLDAEPGLYQPFVRGVLLEGRRLYKVRSHVFVSPLGARFLSCHRTLSTRPVPEMLPPGFVSDPRPFLSSHSGSGGGYAVPPKEEEEEVANASISIANGLAWAASYGFRTGPQDIHEAIQSPQMLLRRS